MRKTRPKYDRTLYYLPQQNAFKQDYYTVNPLMYDDHIDPFSVKELTEKLLYFINMNSVNDVLTIDGTPIHLSYKMIFDFDINEWHLNPVLHLSLNVQRFYNLVVALGLPSEWGYPDSNIKSSLLIEFSVKEIVSQIRKHALLR